jgi:hypothetical protein
MTIGARVALYPMYDDHVDAVLSGIADIAPWRPELRVETDDLATLMIGPPEALFPALQALLTGGAAQGRHAVLAATLSRGLPGGPDDQRRSAPRPRGDREPLPVRVASSLAVVADAPRTGQTVAAQLSLYPLGVTDPIAEIVDCIGFLKSTPVWDRPGIFCSTLRGDAGPVFAAVAEAFLGFGAPDGHVAMDLKVSANSPRAI